MSIHFKKPLNLILIFSVLFVSGCLEMEVKHQPNGAAVGGTFSATTEVLLRNNDFDNLRTMLYAVNMPLGWTINSVAYTSPQHGDGAFAYLGDAVDYDDAAQQPGGLDEGWETALEEAHPSAEGMHWQLYMSDQAVISTASDEMPDEFHITVEYTVNADAAEGHVDLTYWVSYDVSTSALANDENAVARVAPVIVYDPALTSFVDYLVPAAGDYYFEVVAYFPSMMFDYHATVVNTEPVPIVPQNVTATAVGTDLVVTWEPAPTPVEAANAYNLVDGSAPWKDKTTTMHPDKLNYIQPSTSDNSSSRDGSRDAGDTCDESIAYGDINGDAVTDNLEAGGVVWYSFTTDGSHESIDITTNGSTVLSDSRLAVYAACTDVTAVLPGGGLYVVGTEGEIAFDDDGGNSWLSLITLTDLAVGTYYVAVYGYNLPGNL